MNKVGEKERASLERENLVKVFEEQDFLQVEIAMNSDSIRLETLDK